MPEKGCQVKIKVGDVNVGYAKGGTLSCEKGEIDITTLDSSCNKEILGGIRSATLDIPCLFVATDVAQIAITSAWEDDATVAVEIYTATNNGYSFNAKVMSIGMEISLEDAVGLPISMSSTGAITKGTDIS